MSRFILHAKERHYLNPLFWQRNDSPEVLREEMVRMKENGIHDFILESRPHPDYLGEGWWQDLDFILKEAEQLQMVVWFFDDGAYPSGQANGILAQKYPQHTKKYWTECHIDVTGPLPHAHFLIEDWIKEGERLQYIIAGRRTDRNHMMDSTSMIDLTSLYTHGRLYFAVPEGDWRIFVIKVTNRGGEEHTRNYVDPLSKEAVSKYIELVHEEHYSHYAPLFGNRIAGFFTDEPRFGNTTGYDRIIGQSAMPLPYTENLQNMLSSSPLGNFVPWIPLLWYPDEQKRCRDARYLYMDTVSKLFADNFTGQLGDWCRDHKVSLIGHLVEENGAHARLGYGAGHFFRAIRGLDMAGIDVVNNLLPEQTDGFYTTSFNYYDCDFNHWGLAKMASSAAHVDPKKRGRALCEAFGAYGWFEGLKLMKWITDHLVVQGIGIITPHAFSPSAFPDPDCPPHFYARGHNPQFRHFHIWSDYANRLCDALADAHHCAPVAVVYHAEAEWGGKAEPFEKIVKLLAQSQIDCDVVCIDDLLTSARVENGRLVLSEEDFQVLIIPEAEIIPLNFAQKLEMFAQEGLPVIFTGQTPSALYFGGSFDFRGFRALPLEKITPYLFEIDVAPIRCKVHTPDLLVSHYRKDNMDYYFFVNQSTHYPIYSDVCLPDKRSAILYDAMQDQIFAATTRKTEDGTVITLTLDPYTSLFVVFGDERTPKNLPLRREDFAPIQTFRGPWRVSMATSEAYPQFTEVPFTQTVDFSHTEFLPNFCGTLSYEMQFQLSDASKDILIEAQDAGETVEFFVNGESIKVCLCPPYYSFVPAAKLLVGINDLRIEVVNTLVKEEHQNPFDKYFVQDPTGLIGDITISQFTN